MNTVLDVLFLRRPKIDYLSPGICEAVFSSTGFPIIILPDFHRLTGPTGLIITGSFGHRRLHWNAYPGALCYNVYMADCNPDVPPESLSYHLIAECVSDTFFDLPDEGCYRVSAITATGESDLSDPICTCEEPPPPVLSIPVLSRDGRVLSWTVEGASPDTAEIQQSEDGVVWIGYALVPWVGTAHVNSDFNYRVIGLNGITAVTQQSNVVNVPLHPTAVAWRERVTVTHGGTLSSPLSTRAQSDFCYHMDEFNITDKVLMFNGFAYDSMIACMTPLIPHGEDLWVNHNFVDADLNADGLLGNGIDKWINTGLRPAFSDMQEDSSSVFAYESTTTASLSNRVPIGTGSAGLGLVLITNSANNDQLTLWDNSVSAINSSPASGAGFFLGSRVSATELNLYFSNSGTPWALLGTNAAPSIGTRPTSPLTVFGSSFGFTPDGLVSFDDRRISVAGAGLGLTSAEGEALYNGIQALRTALLGGFV